MTRLVGKRVLITGAARGIGLGTAEHFARAGCRLVITDIDGDALDAAAEKLNRLGSRVTTRVYDVSDQQAVDEMAGELGSIDVLINNAGILHGGELADTSIDTWKRLLDVNFLGPLYHTHAFLPQMKSRQSGHIVNVSSGQIFFRLPTWGAYTAVKTALAAYSEILHFELRKYRIKVTTVYPFMADTPIFDKIATETRFARLSMKLAPYYSMRPETVGKLIFEAVQKDRRVERVSVLNDIGRYVGSVPLASDLIATLGSLFLVKRIGSTASRNVRETT